LIKFNNDIIKEPKEFQPEWYKLTKSGRLASGRMVMDIIAKKRKFPFRYDVLNGSELDLILSYVNGDFSFFELTYEINGRIETCTVYAGALKAKKLRKGSIWYWTNVSFDLIEQ